MRDLSHGQCRAPAGVAIKLRQNNSCDRQSSVKAARHADGLLPGRGIDNEQDFLRLQKFFERFQFIHQRVVDFLSPRRIEDLHTRRARRSRPTKRRRRNGLHVLFTSFGNMNRYLDLFPKRCELLDRRGPLQIAGYERWDATLFLQQQRQLGSRGCFARAVKPDDQDACFIFQAKRLCVAAKQHRQFIVKNFHDLLTRRNAAKYTFAKRFLFYASNEFSGDLKVNICLKQRHANLTQCSVDVRLADNAVSTEVFENLLKSIAKLGKHEYGCPPIAPWRSEPSLVGLAITF